MKQNGYQGGINHNVGRARYGDDPKVRAKRVVEPKQPLAYARPGRDLSPRELELIGLLKEGKSNKEIGAEMGLTEGTVKEYMYHIFRVLRMSNREQIIVWWYKSMTPKCDDCILMRCHREGCAA